MMQLSATTHRIMVATAVLLAAGLACSVGRNPTPASDTPVVTLSSPQPGQTAQAGEPVVIQSTSVDPDGIQRVELWVDNTLTRVDANPQPGSPYIVAQAWQSMSLGPHTILVKAFDTQGAEGQSASILISVEAAAQTVPDSTPLAQEPPTPTIGGVPATAVSPTWTPVAPSPTWTPIPTLSSPTNTPMVMCTPPVCKGGEVYYCPGDCPGGCDMQCATPTPTVEPPLFEPTGIEVHAIFKPVWEKAEVKDYLGYPTGTASADRRYAKQYFERGYLYWWDQPNAPGLIWVVEMPQPGANQGLRWSGPYEDLWDGQDDFSCAAARANPNGPLRGFGKLWCDHPEIPTAIGAARDEERGTGDSANYGVVQVFQGGIMLYSPLDRLVWVLFNGSRWQRYPR